jgi:hypothetical protein
LITIAVEAPATRSVVSIYIGDAIDWDRHEDFFDIFAGRVFKISNLLVCHRALKILLIGLIVGLEVPRLEHLVWQVLQVILIYLSLHPCNLKEHIVDLQLPAQNLLLLPLDLVGETNELARILTVVHDPVVNVACEEHAILYCNWRLGPIVCDCLDWVNVEDDRVGVLRCVVEVYEELHWHDEVFEVLHEQVAHSPEDPWHSVVLEASNE